MTFYSVPVPIDSDEDHANTDLTSILALLQEGMQWLKMTEGGPLLGLRVLNTRSPEDAEQLSHRLQELGAEVIELPATRIAPPEDLGPLDRTIDVIISGSPAAPSFDWIGFTSAHAVYAFMDRFLELSQPTRAGTRQDWFETPGWSALSSMKKAAVGQATAKALESYGVAPDLVPSRGSGKELALALGDVSGKRILLPRSNIALRDLPEALEARGAAVTEVVAYITELAPASDQPLAVVLAGQLDAATFFSPSAIDGLAAQVTPRKLNDVLRQIQVICVGETTARAARSKGLTQVLVAQEATVEGVLKAIVKWRMR